MPVTLSLDPANSICALEKVVDRSASRNGLMVKAGNGRLRVDVQPREKMALLQTLFESGELADVGIHQPSLEDIYVHFIGTGGLAHRGGGQ
jgi:Cu-processing system ATP-binding protein